MTNQEEQIREELAELEHEQWVEWSKDLSHMEDIRPARLARWKKLWRPYAELTEAEKDQDREWADKVLARFRERESSQCECACDGCHFNEAHCGNNKCGQQPKEQPSEERELANYLVDVSWEYPLREGMTDLQLSEFKDTLEKIFIDIKQKERSTCCYACKINKQDATPRESEQPSELSQCCGECMCKMEREPDRMCHNQKCICHNPRQTTQPLSKSTQKEDNLPIPRQEKPSDATITCLSINCPERTGGKCNVLERMEVANKEPWWEESLKKELDSYKDSEGDYQQEDLWSLDSSLKTFISSIEQKTRESVIEKIREAEFEKWLEEEIIDLIQRN